MGRSKHAGCRSARIKDVLCMQDITELCPPLVWLKAFVPAPPQCENGTLKSFENRLFVTNTSFETYWRATHSRDGFKGFRVMGAGERWMAQIFLADAASYPQHFSDTPSFTSQRCSFNSQRHFRRIFRSNQMWERKWGD